MCSVVTPFSLLQGLTAAHDGHQTGFQCSQDLGIDIGIGLAHSTALGVADDHILAAGIHQHVGSNFAGVSTGGVGVNILGTDAYPSLTHSADSGGNADGRNTQGHITPTALGHNSLQLGHKLLGLGGGLVHLPVTGEDGLTILSVHFPFSPY